MSRTVSITNVPENVIRSLERRAAKHHRSLQGEVLAILEQAVRSPDVLSVRELFAEARRVGVRTPREAASIIRKDRDAR